MKKKLVSKTSNVLPQNKSSKKKFSNGVFGDLKIMFTVCIVLFLYRFVELTPQTPLNQRAFSSSSQQQESYVNDVFDDGYYDDDRDFLPMEVPKSMSNTGLTVILLNFTNKIKSTQTHLNKTY
jgi:hypothetical protein